MEIFYSNNIAKGKASLTAEESVHCIRVLRHKTGDTIKVSGGDGNLYECVITEASTNSTKLDVIGVIEEFGTHNYYLELGVAPTKNIDRFEWFLEKSTELGIDRIIPLLCSHSERKILRKDRAEKIVLSAAKQSLKGSLPIVEELTPALEYIRECSSFDGIKLIAYCDSELINSQGESIKRIPLTEAIDKQAENCRAIVLIGPEGDFSREEIAEAAKAGFIPISLGNSRLRTETAALMSVLSFYLKYNI